jgi:hypothetical protein
MIALFLLAAAAQVQAVRLPPVIVAPPATQPAPRVIAPTVLQPPPGTDLRATVLPDLVVKAIRVEEGGMHVQVANEGNGDAKAFTVKGSASVGPRYASTMIGGVSPGLAAGGTQWVKVVGFAVAGEPAYPPPPPLELSKATAVSATADPPPSLGSSWGNSTPSLPGGTAKPPCTASEGCIREANEGNNELRLTGDAIGRGKPQ